MAASYCILMVRGEAEIGNSYDAQRSDGSSSVSRPRNIQSDVPLDVEKREAGVAD